MYLNFLLISILLLPITECRKGAGSPVKAPTTSQAFYFGADLSYVNQVLDHGGVYRADGKVESPYKIFKDHGTNLIRVRLWHNPAWVKEVYGGSFIPVYSGLADVEKTIRLAKEQGMQVELDLHYSDTWADPGKQEPPDAWKHIKKPSILKDSIYNYTYSTLMYLHSKDLMPEMIQLGNEINCGLFFSKAPEEFPLANACRGDWKLLGSYLQSGIKAVRDAEKKTGKNLQVVLHVADPKNVVNWFQKITSIGKVNDFDVIGFSYYPLWHTTISLESISDEITKYREKFKKSVMVLETAYPWTIAGNDHYRNSFGSQKPLKGYPFSVQGQEDFLIALTREVIEGGGSGVIYWEPAWISSEMKDLWGKGSSWENAALFDFSGNAMKSMRYMKQGYK